LSRRSRRIISHDSAFLACHLVHHLQ